MMELQILMFACL